MIQLTSLDNSITDERFQEIWDETFRPIKPTDENKERGGKIRKIFESIDALFGEEDRTIFPDDASFEPDVRYREGALASCGNFFVFGQKSILKIVVGGTLECRIYPNSEVTLLCVEELKNQNSLLVKIVLKTEEIIELRAPNKIMKGQLLSALRSFI